MFENLDPSTSQKQDTSAEIKSDNIFKELSGTLDFWDAKEIESAPEKKTKEYYLKNGSLILGLLNILLLFFFIGMWGYVKIQTNPNMYSKAFLDPVCFLLNVENVENTWENCSSVAALLQDYQTKKQTLSTDIATKILANVNDYYSIENFLYSKEVGFLLNTKNSKLKTLEIINEFDLMKNAFAPDNDKKIVQCMNLNISRENLLSVDCEVYSPQWFGASNNETALIWDTGDRNTSVIEGTSTTVAYSFINYIEKNPSSKFTLVDEVTNFSTQKVLWIGDFVYKTRFSLNLQYSPNPNLSF